MKVLGIVAEYNPFHNGHLYHLKKSLELTGATHSLAIMSGHFLQRGEPALINKWSRAKMAVASGVDLVIEMPVVYSCQSAETFALGALSILDKTNAVDCICFGSESGDIEQLEHISDIFYREPIDFKKHLKLYLKKGFSFPSARAKALQKYDEKLATSSLITAESPNNILALEYLKAIKTFNSSITPYTIKRIGTGYNSTAIRCKIASATAIRKKVLSSKQEIIRVSKVIPQISLKILNDELIQERGPVHENLFSTQLISHLRKSRPEDLTMYPGVSEGLENKIWNAARNSVMISEMLKQVKSKRYTLTRLKRIMINILLEIHSDLLNNLKNNMFPGYVRILAFNHKGRDILRRIKLNSSIPIITKTAVHRLQKESLCSYVMEKDLLATDIYVLGYPGSKYSFAGQDFLTSPILVKD